jgi:putative DNA primase/helicase
VLLETIAGVLGDYAGQAPPGLLEATKNEGHPTELYFLRGRRFVFASETEAGIGVRHQRIKQLTGDRHFTARGMRQDFSTFERTFKMVLVTNNKPRITEDSEGMWRRVLLVPFDVIIPAEQRDPHLFTKLKDEWPGILGWLINGCLQWQRAGRLYPTRDIADATEQYRREENAVADFLEECCELGPYQPGEAEQSRFAISAVDLYQRYKQWAERSGRHVLLNRGFASALRKAVPSTEKQTVKFDGRAAAAWAGIKLKRDEREGADPF